MQGERKDLASVRRSGDAIPKTDHGSETRVILSKQARKHANTQTRKHAKGIISNTLPPPLLTSPPPPLLRSPHLLHQSLHQTISPLPPPSPLSPLSKTTATQRPNNPAIFKADIPPPPPKRTNILQLNKQPNLPIHPQPTTHNPQPTSPSLSSTGTRSALTSCTSSSQKTPIRPR
ncbi:hypothetical protein MBM_09226 [Drepanopeziza brunnea f. sp. 'multigermtubi' MB_m1]|uniref:Uncharacterized protein n=1 Tax=Marssonina brunnea f. sp. multigermtubi (strain MB_m1) TaxID=1072389 RepID=K1WKD3_MARBU|nr:uncharacterized protein MBM_09226 [Drepanopeziza brunnea f. sp. 'multigermtubi' MB_m1]EKD12657.1 hypothetical protein MBM_09226 [Drepanopeziza brunnea f. sp. 'multigermtubi' MB_m1]